MNTLTYAQDFKIFNAVSLGYLNYVQEFLVNGGDVDISDDLGATLLHYSIFSNQTQAAIMLIEAEADINTPDLFGRTAFYFALINKNQEVTQALIERDATLDPNSDGSKTFTPIDISQLVPSWCISDSHQTWIHAKTHPEFLPYIEKYLSIKKDFTGQEELDYPIKILFYRSDSDVWRQVSRLAERFTFQGAASSVLESRHIFINYDAWVTFSETTKEIHIFHELGHVDLDRDHTPRNTTSIMNTFYTQSLFLQGVDINEDPTLKQELYEELFSKRGDIGDISIERQAYPTDLQGNDPEVCPVPTRLYLDEINTSL